ncbi:MAG: type II secretion system protein [Campylobacterales bacterium]|nr:type II secretion system protein [Campylobacterales bacterium]
MRKVRILKTKKAFTLLELTMVIVVLGIVASIGSSIIAQVYEQYILQRATHRASLKTELAAQQIANLLSYRIPRTTIARQPANLSNAIYVTDPTNMTDNIHTQLEWIGTDNDGFSADIPPSWNGFCDVNASTQNSVRTPGSRLLNSTASHAAAHDILSNLSNGNVSLDAAGQHPAIFFRDRHRRYSDDIAGNEVTMKALPDGTDPACLGMVSSDRSCISTVSAADDENFAFQWDNGNTQKVISEHYKLAWSAYSICPRPRGGNHYDLILHYNYQPWEGERLDGQNCNPTVGESAILITNVTVFKFAESGNTFRFKLCAQESIGGDTNVTICKEKAVIL